MERTGTECVLHLPADANYLAQAREHLAAFLGDGELSDAVKLVVTELVENAIKHAGINQDDDIVVSVYRSGRRVRVEVEDPGRGFAMPPPEASWGRGLPLVQALATRFGLYRERATRVWAEFDG